ncbi:nitroreductase family protein [Moraxella nasovis]|uniref:nitroreductase family protein n=1 Tax=Moraxella nasovis TaxID=2904121 RepID=UPI001F60B38B|nr:nitroreductase family protein [Moraxella nasovis]UNU74163.1 nitroreductase family protein [Moraxella nasovis]
MNINTLYDIREKRRSIYHLGNNLPVDNTDIKKIIEHAVLHTPSAFNSQSTRLVVLFGDEHKKLWSLTEMELRKIVPAEKFKSTEQKLNGFKNGAGTVLFFEDTDIVKRLQEQFPTYADNFPTWSEHTNAMHQYAIWTALTAVDVGANLQHYNPIIDDEVAKTWNVPKTYKLMAQLVFGSVQSPASDKEFTPLKERIRYVGI